MADDSRIASILGEWQEQLDRGEDVDPEHVISDHPELADELRQQFKALSQMRHARVTKQAPDRLRTLPIDRYAEFRAAGKGGMGIVYWAIDSDLNREVAFKIIRAGKPEELTTAPATPTELAPPGESTPAGKSFDALKQRFLQEAWITSGMAHPGIVPVYELGQTPEGVPYYTMRFIRGERTLATVIAETKGKPMEERLALLEPYLKVCDTLRYAHSRGVIHRDLKPENIAIGEFGEVVLLDWGLAKLKNTPDLEQDRLQAHVQAYRDATDLKTVAGALGTPGYMGPEAAMSKSDDMDERSDVYSLGAMLFEILTGRLPFLFETFGELGRQLLGQDAPRANQIDPNVPDTLSDLCARCLARDMEQRPPTVEAVAQTLRFWQRESAARREVRGNMREADTALEGIEGLRGDTLLRQLDRVTALSRRVLELRPGHGRARRLIDECEDIRRRAIAEREATIRETERREKGRLLKRFAAAAVIVLLIGSAVAAFFLDKQRRAAEDARGRTVIALTRMEEERNAKSRALAEVEAERDAKRDALAKVEAESAAKEAALKNVEAERDAKDEALAKVEAERDAKTRALERLQAEQAAREAAEAEVDTERGKTQQEIRRNRTLELVSASIDAQKQDPMLSLLLAREAARTQMLPEVVTRLHDAIGASYERAELRGHEGAVFTAAFSPEGDTLLTASQDGTARLWKESGDLLAALEGHTGPVRDAVFSPDGDLIATVSDDGTARLWQPDGTHVATLVGHKDAVTAVAWAPSGKRLVTASNDGKARLWNTKGKETALLMGHAGPLTSVAYAPNGDTILTASQDGTARLWGSNGKPRKTLDRHRGAVRQAIYSPNGKRILTVSDDGTARLWDLKGKSLETLRGHEGVLTAAAFSPDNDRVLTASVDGTARLWSTKGEELLVLADHPMPVTAVAFSPSGRRIFTASEDKTVRVWRSDGEPVRTYLGHDAAIHAIAFAASPDRILSTSADGTARVWSLDGGEVALYRLRGTEEEDPVPGASTPYGRRTAATPGSRILWSGTQQAEMRGVDGTLERAWFIDGGKGVFCVTRVANTTSPLVKYDTWAQQFDLDGKEILKQQLGNSQAVSPVGDRYVFSERLGPPRGAMQIAERISYLRTHKGRKIRLGREIVNVKFSQDGKYFIGFQGGDGGAGGRAQAYVWDHTGRLIGKVHVEQTNVTHVALSPNGRDFFCVTPEGVGQRWSLRKRKKMAVYPDLSTSVRWVGFSPTGEHLLVLIDGQPPRLISVEDESDVKLLAHMGGIWMAAFSPKGDRILTSGADKTVRLWDLHGNQLAVCQGHRGAVRHASFSNQGDRVVTGSDDRTARIWDMQGNELAVIRGPTAPVTQARFAPDDETILTASGNVIRLWSLEARSTAEPEAVQLLTTRAAISPSGELVATCAGDLTPRLWGPKGLHAVLEGHIREAVDVAFRPNDEAVLAISRTGAIRLWDRDGNSLLDQSFPVVQHQQQGPVRLAGFLPGKDYCLVQIFGSAWVWDIRSRAPVGLVGHKGPVLSATVSPDRERILTTAADGQAILWTATGQRVQKLGNHGGPVQTGAFSPDGKTIATASGNVLHLWPLEGRLPLKGVGHEDTIHTIAFSSVGDLVLTASADGTARIWDIQGQERAVLRGHGWDVLSAVFSADSKRILTASKDKTARLWDLQGNELAVLRGHDAWIGQALFLPDGKHILTCSEDGTARVWLANDVDVRRLAEIRILREFTEDEKARYADLITSPKGASDPQKR